MTQTVAIAHKSLKVVRCSRCMRKMRGGWRNPNAAWNTTLRAGVIVGYLCPDCQTPEENAEAEIKAATLVYSRDSFGRSVGSARV